MSSATAAAVAAESVTVFTTDVDADIWRTIAGSTVRIPSVGSRVYYFPEGHAEHLNNHTSASMAAVSLGGPQPSSLFSVPSFFFCGVVSVKFFADPLSDQVFAKLLLLPLRPSDVSSGEGGRVLGNGGFASSEINGDGPLHVENGNDPDVVSFAKILTPSDANNGGGFSVPRFCADSILPPLDFAADPPVQNLFVRDVHGNVFEFRHIYRGTPRRHLLTTGWSKFVNAKKLVAGDAVVFMRKKSTEGLFVGVRRALKGSGATASRWNCPVVLGASKMEQKVSSDGGEVFGFWRSVNGRAVVEAVEMAARNMPFEVEYYPRLGWADFVVNAKMVDQSMSVLWTAGMRVKMAMETEDSSRLTWFHGMVSRVSVPDNRVLYGSPWRMLQITWDEPEILQNATRVNPWQLESVVPSASFHSASPYMKKIKVFQSPEDAEEELLFPVTGLSNSMMGHLSPLCQNCTSPAGMQGARQDQFCVTDLSNFKSEIIHQAHSDSFFNNDMKQKMKTVSTELNIGSSQSENLSPDSQGSVHFSGTEQTGKMGSNTSTQVGVYAFQLFGKTIHIEESVEDGLDYVGCTVGESKKM